MLTLLAICENNELSSNIIDEPVNHLSYFLTNINCRRHSDPLKTRFDTAKIYQTDLKELCLIYCDPWYIKKRKRVEAIFLSSYASPRVPFVPCVRHTVCSFLCFLVNSFFFYFIHMLRGYFTSTCGDAGVAIAHLKEHRNRQRQNK